MARFVKHFLVVFVIISCSRLGEDENNSQTIDEADLNRVGTYKTTTIIYKDSLSAQECYVVSDTLLIAIRAKQMGAPVVELVKMKSGEKRSLYRYGGEDNQLLSVQAHCDGRKLLLHDYIKQELYLIDIRRLEREKKYQPKGKKTEIESQYIIPGRWGRYMYLNPESFERRDHRILNSARMHMAKTRHFKTSSFNVVRGAIHKNEVKGRQCYVDQHNGVLEFWNHRSLFRMVEVEMPVGPRYSDYKQLTYIFKGKIPFSFVASCINDQYVAVLFEPREMGADEGFSYFYNYPVLLIFDWDGNCVEMKQIEAQQRPNSISYSSDGDIFFVSCAKDSVYVMK